MAVHALTAAGAGLAFMALMAAVRAAWPEMFGWLGAALLVDAVDGPLARRVNVAQAAAHIDGDMLDLVVDFTTYVFVPAYAIAASGLLPAGLAPLCGALIVLTGALYFADRRMKHDDNSFRGFPALWNLAAFYLFLLRPAQAAATIAVVALAIATFLPIRIMHPVRVTRRRILNLGLMAVWSVCAIYAVATGFDAGMPVTIALCAIALYVGVADPLIGHLQRARI
jgi:phosphatidylcholine synthase